MPKNINKLPKSKAIKKAPKIKGSKSASTSTSITDIIKNLAAKAPEVKKPYFIP